MKTTKSYLEKPIREQVVEEFTLKPARISYEQANAQKSGKRFLSGRGLLGSTSYIDDAVTGALSQYNAYISADPTRQKKMLEVIYEIMEEYYNSNLHGSTYNHWKPIVRRRFQEDKRRLIHTFNLQPDPADLKPHEVEAGILPASQMRKARQSIVEIVGQAIKGYETRWGGSFEESKKSENEIILEVHKKNRKLSPAVKDNWWQDA
jgi:hypothetical protein